MGITIGAGDGPKNEKGVSAEGAKPAESGLGALSVSHAGAVRQGQELIFQATPEAKEALAVLHERTDRAARTAQRLLALPDLTRTENSPVRIVLDAIVGLERFKSFDIATIPEIVHVRDNFDTLNTPLDHPARRPSDTYYLKGDVRDGYVLRTQTTAMWPYYLSNPEVRTRLENDGMVGALAYGRVFRNDEVDRTHYPCFHQIDGLHVIDRRLGRIEKQDVVDVLLDIARAIYGPDVETLVSQDSFPFTDPSLEVGVKLDGKWLEILGAGCVHPQVLSNLGLDPEKYSGWAFGFGVDRLAMVKMNIPDIRVLWSEDPRIKGQFTDLNSQYEAVSRYPSTFRDISFLLQKDMSLNRFFEIVREEGLVNGENAVELVEMIDQYENDKKFGPDRRSYTFRTTYRSHERTLSNADVNETQNRIRKAVEAELGATLR